MKDFIFIHIQKTTNLKQCGITILYSEALQSKRRHIYMYKIEGGMWHDIRTAHTLSLTEKHIFISILFHSLKTKQFFSFSLQLHNLRAFWKLHNFSARGVVSKYSIHTNQPAIWENATASRSFAAYVGDIETGWKMWWAWKTLSRAQLDSVAKESQVRDGVILDTK